jgi:hypothetical protein
MSVDLKIATSEGMNHGHTAEAVLATIDFADWNFYPQQEDDFSKALEILIRKTVAEAVRNTLSWQPPTVEFESDGVSLTVSINLGSSWNDGWLYFTANIVDLIDDFIWRTDPNQMAGGDEARIELAKCLRLCARRIELAATGRPV